MYKMKIKTFPLRNPKPNFEELQNVIKGNKKAERVHFVELFTDPEITTFIIENLLGEKAIPETLIGNKPLSTPGMKEELITQYVKVWYRMGYDYIPLVGARVNDLYFPGKEQSTTDTALINRGERVWLDEGIGMIHSWKDFEEYPWPDVDKIDYSIYEYSSDLLPEGMKIITNAGFGILEVCSEILFGFEGMSYLLYDNPELVEAVFNKVGELIYHFYENVAEINGIGAFFQGDDMGFKTSTLFSPQVLRKYVLPWHKKYAAVAHQHNKMYWLHSCGNIFSLMDDLIEDVRIDAFHSFQDEVFSVIEFYKKYGKRVTTLGGVDVDKLCTLDEIHLRSYVREILDECMPYRFALGSGNSISNYTPVESYLIMLDEGLNW